jgi:hypothetical protein
MSCPWISRVDWHIANLAIVVVRLLSILQASSDQIFLTTTWT